MRVNCLACGHKVDLDDAYDDYEGPVKCFGCRATLEIRTEQGSIKAVKQVGIARHPSAEEAFEPVLKPMNEAPMEAA
jgi:DNA-directed RNA polymerase subunit N (RpoN/RPB10)